MYKVKAKGGNGEAASLCLSSIGPRYCPPAVASALLGSGAQLAHTGNVRSRTNGAEGLQRYRSSVSEGTSFIEEQLTNKIVTYMKCTK